MLDTKMSVETDSSIHVVFNEEGKKCTLNTIFNYFHQKLGQLHQKLGATSYKFDSI